MCLLHIFHDATSEVLLNKLKKVARFANIFMVKLLKVKPISQTDRFYGHKNFMAHNTRWTKTSKALSGILWKRLGGPFQCLAPIILTPSKTNMIAFNHNVWSSTLEFNNCNNEAPLILLICSKIIFRNYFQVKDKKISNLRP